jgi:DNA-binding CsgD family transcriptional regulator
VQPHDHDHDQPDQQNRPIVHSRHAADSTGPDVLVHSGLGDYFATPSAPLGRLRSGLRRVEFVDDEELTAPGRPLDLAVLVPVTSEPQAEKLRTVRARHPMSLLVAVTHDISGLRTYYGIRAGADFVLNLAILGDAQTDLLRAHIRAHRMIAAARSGPAAGLVLTRLRAVPADDGRDRGLYQGGGPADGDRHAEPTLRGSPVPAAPPPPDYDTELVRLLCTSMTVTEIARHHYCSERSMYRRIRKLYDALGVGSRAELMSAAARLGLQRQRQRHGRDRAG